MKARLNNFDLLKPHFYIVKWVYRGIHYFFYYFAKKNMIMGTPKNPLTKVVVTSTHNLCFEQKYEKYQNFLSEIFPFFFCL